MTPASGTSSPGASNDGIDIFGAGTDGQHRRGQLHRDRLTGTIPLGIAGNGVVIADGASSNWVGVNPDGGSAPATRET